MIRLRSRFNNEVSREEREFLAAGFSTHFRGRQN